LVKELSFAAASRSVAADFLQTVVVIDDEAQFPQSSNSPGNVKSQESPTDDAGLALVTPSMPHQGAAYGFDAKSLVDSFATEGIICGVIKPAHGDDVLAIGVPAAVCADVVILDWHFDGDDGAASLSLLDKIATCDEESGRVRLFVVYTGDPELRNIVTKIIDRLSGHFTAHPLSRHGDFRVRKGPLCVSVYAKPNSRLSGADGALASRQKEPHELSASLIVDFAFFMSGLVPNVVLASMAAIRSNTHAMLSGLGSELDPAYLLHRLLQTTPEDAEEEIVELVAAEILSILEDSRVGRQADIVAIKRWLIRTGVKDFSYRFRANQNQRNPAPVSRDDVVLALNSSGVNLPNARLKSLRKDHKRQRLKAFASTEKESQSSNRKLAVKMSLRSYRPSVVPVLTLGTIISNVHPDSGRAYWLCVQPVCDTVRLDGAVRFPFLPLVLAQGDQEQFGILIRRPANYVHLRVAIRPTDITMLEFQNSADADCVVANRDGSALLFESTDRTGYQWEAQLRTHKALSIAHRLGAALGSPGWSESEWLRRSDKQ
jgi:hypothetical protein